MLIGKQGDADAGRAVAANARQVIGFVQLYQYLVANTLHLCRRPAGLGTQVFQQHHEFVPAQAGHGVTFSHAIHQSLPHLLQQQVARVVPEGVVDGFELVQVQQHQGPRAPISPAGQHALLQSVHQQAAVGQTGQRVIKRQVLDFFLRRLALGNVGQGGHVMRGLVIWGSDGGDGEPLGVGLAILAPVPDFSFPYAGAVQQAMHRPIKVGTMAPRAQNARVLPHRLRRAVAGNGREGAVDLQNHAMAVGDEHALLRLERGGRNAQPGVGFPAFLHVVQKGIEPAHQLANLRQRLGSLHAPMKGQPTLLKLLETGRNSANRVDDAQGEQPDKDRNQHQAKQQHDVAHPLNLGHRRQQSRFGNDADHIPIFVRHL